MSVRVLGSINLDRVFRTSRLPLAGETIAAESLADHPGGKGANQAIASARWGAATSLVGAVGEDAAGDFLLAAAGVDVSGVARRAGAPTGQAAIFVSPSGENMIVVAGGANATLTRLDLAGEATAPAKVWLAQLETPVDAVEAFFEAARGPGALTILNAAPAIPEGRRLFEAADILIVNETELAAYAGPGASEDGVAKAARTLISRAGQSVIVTLGAKGAMAVDRDGVFRVEGRAARVVDATGAGDAFCGVLAASLSEGTPLKDALHLANIAGALSTERAGASVSPDLRADVARVAPSVSFLVENLIASTDD
jgi:ribokinase